MNKGVRGYRDLEVWQVAMSLVEEVYRLTEDLPADQRFGLIPKMQRAAVSIPSNIAEGYAKRSGRDYRRHLMIAAGSTAELETQIELCVRLKLIQPDRARDAWSHAQRVAQMLTRLIQSLTRAPSPEPCAPSAEPRAPIPKPCAPSAEPRAPSAEPQAPIP